MVIIQYEDSLIRYLICFSYYNIFYEDFSFFFLYTRSFYRELSLTTLILIIRFIRSQWTNPPLLFLFKYYFFSSTSFPDFFFFCSYLVLSIHIKFKVLWNPLDALFHLSKKIYLLFLDLSILNTKRKVRCFTMIPINSSLPLSAWLSLPTAALCSVHWAVAN